MDPSDFPIFFADSSYWIGCIYIGSIYIDSCSGFSMFDGIYSDGSTSSHVCPGKGFPPIGSSTFNKNQKTTNNLHSTIVKSAAPSSALSKMRKRKRSSNEEESREGVYNFDWFEKGYVSRSMSQGLCGCCYAFVATDAITSSHAIKHRDKSFLKRLSGQQFVDCCKYEPCNGCKEGDVGSCLQWAQDNDLYYAADYPYMSGKNIKPTSCRGKELKRNGVASAERYKVHDVFAHENPSIDEVIEMIDSSPVGAVMDACDLEKQLGSKEIWSGCEGLHEEEPHAVLITGHGRDENEVRYWNVKSSWGSLYGDQGFHRVKMGKCGLLDIIYQCVVADAEVCST